VFWTALWGIRFPAPVAESRRRTERRPGPVRRVRLVVEREREIEAFVPEEYWRVTGYFTTDPHQSPCPFCGMAPLVVGNE